MSNHTLNTPTQGYSNTEIPAEVRNITLTPDNQSPLRNGVSPNILLNAYAAKAVLSFIKKDEGDVALVDVGGQTYAAEMPLGDGNTLVATTNRPDPQGNTIRLQAAIVGPMVGNSPARSVIPVTAIERRTQLNLAPIFACLIPYAISTWGGISDEMSVLETAYATDKTIPPDSFCAVADTLSVMLDQGLFQISVPGGNIDMLSQTRLMSGALAGEVMCGKPDILTSNGMASSTHKRASTFADAKKMFAGYAKNHSWTAAERALIPQFPDDYPVPPEAVEIARKFVKTRGTKRPMNNFMWRGITSYGKSTGVELMAAFLDIPLLRMTCNSTMETQNFLSDIIPDTSIANVSEMPQFEEISADPASAYYKLTGIEDENATCQMALEAYGKAAASQNAVARYKFVESNYVKALEHGYIVEVQEISRIKDSGVLVGLNEFDRAGAMIPLVDGRFVRRHPDAMVVYTDNVGYASCRAVDPSVIRRAAFVIDSYELSKGTLLSRVKYNTGFSDNVLLDKMYTVWEATQACANLSP